MSRISFVVVMGSLLLFLGSCTRESNYDRLVKTEMANGVYSDSLKFGLLLGDTKKTFYTKCWELNLEGIISHGPNNDFVAYELEGLNEGERINHLFYGIFDDENSMTGLDMRFYHLGWAPWNKQLFAEQLLPKALDTLEMWYPGNEFIRIDREGLPRETYVKVDGNRQILAYVLDDKEVKAVITDLRKKYPDLAR